MAHEVLIAIHSATGLVALVCGLAALRLRSPEVSSMFRQYLSALWLMVVFLLAAVVVDWQTIDGTARIVYAALALLALYMGWRGWQALQILRHPTSDWQGRYIESVGFTLIALFDGFIIVSALDLNVLPWLVIVIAVVGVLAGRLMLSEFKQRAITST